MSARLIVVVPPTKPPHQFRSLSFNPIFHPSISKHEYRSCFLVNEGSRYFNNGRRTRSNVSNIPKRDLTVYSSVLPGPPGPSPSSWRSWVLGALVTIILPFFGHKWGPLYKITKELEAAVDTVEHITDVIEKVAEEAEKIAEEVAEELPEGGKLRRAVEVIENAADKTAMAAHLAGEIIDKVEEIEKEVESLMEPVNEQANATTDQ